MPSAALLVLWVLRGPSLLGLARACVREVGGMPVVDDSEESCRVDVTLERTGTAERLGWAGCCQIYTSSLYGGAGDLAYRR